MEVLFVAVIAFLMRGATAEVTSLFILGDDYVDVGSTKFKKSYADCAVPPYGMSQTVANGRCSNGALFIDQMAKQFSLDPPPGPWDGPDDFKKNGINFAHVGAGALPATNEKLTYGLDQQMSQFRYFVSKNPGLSLNKSFVVISFGMNDYIQAVLKDEDPVALTDQIVPKIVDTIKEIQKLTGAYRFVVVSPPPIGCLPLLRQKYQAPVNSCLTNLNALSQNQDSRLDLLLDRLVAEQPNGAPLYYSRFSLNKLFQDPKMGTQVFTRPWDVACGLVDSATGTIYNCGQEVEYIDKETGKEAKAPVGATKIAGWDYWWWDWLNPTQDAHYMMWVNMWVKTEMTYPMNSIKLSEC